MPLPLLAAGLSGLGQGALALGGKAIAGAMANPLSALMGASSIASSVMGNKAQKDAIKQAEAQRQANMGLIQEYGQRASQAILPGYQQAQNIRQQALNQNLGMAGSTFRPMIEQMQSGDRMAQEAILAGLMGQRNAILGKDIDYSALQPQNVPVNFNALSGLMSPQGLQFQPIQAPDFGDTAQTTFTAFDTQEYLRKRPDVAADYARMKDQLIAGGDPQFRTLEGYAKWHYDNYGKQEAMNPAQTSQLVTSEQMSKILNAGQER